MHDRVDLKHAVRDKTWFASTVGFMTAIVYTSTSGTLGSVLAILLVALAACIPAWAIGHAVGTSRQIFELQGRSKTKWVAWMSVLFLAGDFAGFVVAIWYLTKVRPGLNTTLATRRPGSSSVVNRSGFSGASH